LLILSKFFKYKGIYTYLPAFIHKTKSMKFVEVCHSARNSHTEMDTSKWTTSINSQQTKKFGKCMKNIYVRCLQARSQGVQVGAVHSTNLDAPKRNLNVSKTNMLISLLKYFQHPDISTCCFCWMAVVGNNIFLKT
jgi:hypothetical protein